MEDNSTGEQELSIIKTFHDEAYLVIDRALSLEENQNSQEACSLYENGIRLLEQALSIRCDRPQCTGDSWDKARLLQMKMRKSREDVMSRLAAVAKERPDIYLPSSDEVMSDEMPPSYEEACHPSSDVPAAPTRPPRSSKESVTSPATSKSFHDVCEKLPASNSRGIGRCTSIPPEANPIFNIASGVQIFFVSTCGEVSAPSYPTALTIYKLKKETVPAETQVPPAFLEVGEWIYPLIPGQMPVLHTTYGAYMLPDTNSITPGAAVGLLLTDGISDHDRQIFEHLMCELTVLKSEVVRPSEEAAAGRRMSTKISEGIVTGAELLSKGMVYGAEKTSEYIKYAANRWRQNMEPVHSPTYVDPNVQRGMQIARNVSDAAVKVTGYLLNQLGRATVALGQQLAPHIRQQGANLLAKAFGEEDPKKADETMNSVLEVAAGGLKGFSTMYMALQGSAKILANSLISETVTTVNYKYGAEAASTTGNGLHTVGNVAYAAYNVNHMGIKAIAKRTATDTGKAVIQQHKNGEKCDDNNCKPGPSTKS